MRTQTTAELEALIRLFAVAAQDTGQARRTADFLLAWHNTPENGGWDPTDLWNVNEPVADDILTVLHLLKEQHLKKSIDDAICGAFGGCKLP